MIILEVIEIFLIVNDNLVDKKESNWEDKTLISNKLKFYWYEILELNK